MDRQHIDSLVKAMDRELRIAVVGDIMLDVYTYGTVNRISPEFPVPILHTPEAVTTPVPGGAGNVAAQFAHFNVRPYLFGVADEETMGVMSKYNFCLDGCVRLAEGRTPRKVRFYDGDFPLLRYDIEAPHYGATITANQSQVFERFAAMLGRVGFDAVVLSNYSKGLFDEGFAQAIIRACNEAHVPTIVDPRNNLHWWKGCYVFKPNAREAKAICPSHDAWPDQSRHIKQQLGCWGVVITRAGDGVSGTTDTHFNYEPKAPSRNVSSVIGAGDCFAAVMAFAIAHRLPVAVASELAFEAGVQYVMEKHNRPITWYELHRRLDPVRAKFVTADELLYLKKHILAGQKLVFTNGCFDILHAGHLDTLNFAKSQGHKLIVAINGDESIRRLKGPKRPILPLAERMDLLANLGCVDFVMAFVEDDPYAIIDAVQPDIIVKGSEYQGKQVAGGDFAGSVVLAPMRERMSTTSIIERVLEKHIA